MSSQVLPSIQVKVEEVDWRRSEIRAGGFRAGAGGALAAGTDVAAAKGNCRQVSGAELDERSSSRPGQQLELGTLKPLQSTRRKSSQPPFDLVCAGRPLHDEIDRTVQPAVSGKYTGVNATLGSSRRSLRPGAPN